MMKYIKPQIEIAEVDLVLLSGSGPCATDIGSPSVSNECKSIWDEDDETHYNNKKEEQDYEDWI